MPGVPPEIAHLLDMLSSLPPDQRPQALAQMGVPQPAAQQFLGMLASVGGGAPGGPGPRVPPGAHVVSLTQPEAAAVQRIMGLGFSQQEALEAYLVCDKNEVIAANMFNLLPANCNSRSGNRGWLLV